MGERKLTNEQKWKKKYLRNIFRRTGKVLTICGALSLSYSLGALINLGDYEDKLREQFPILKMVNNLQSEIYEYNNVLEKVIESEPQDIRGKNTNALEEEVSSDLFRGYLKLKYNERIRLQEKLRELNKKRYILIENEEYKRVNDLVPRTRRHWIYYTLGIISLFTGGFIWIPNSQGRKNK